MAGVSKKVLFPKVLKEKGRVVKSPAFLFLSIPMKIWYYTELYY